MRLAAFAAAPLPSRHQRTPTTGVSTVVCTMRATRRESLSLATITAAALLLPTPAKSAAPSAVLQSYVDLPKGFKILRPSGWNQFEANIDLYDIKWADVIQPLEFVTVLTSPVAADKSLTSIGDLRDVGGRLAKARGGDLLEASEKDIDGIPAYVFEIRKGTAHQLTLLTVNKSKLYSVNASSGENRWKKREKLLRGVIDSFQPKL